MTPPPDPFEVHLARAQTLFKSGDVKQAGQIWQAILKRDPANRAAKAGLYQVKLALEQRPESTDPDQLLRDGCALFDLGQWAEALGKWERVLVLDPRNRLALAYANDARRELGLPALHPQAGGRPDSPTPNRALGPDPEQAPAGDPDRLVLEGVQLYDMGMVDEAVIKWERALALAPEHKDAPAYLQMARREREAEQRRVPEEAPVPAPVAAPPPSAPVVIRPASPEPPAADPRESRIAHAEHLLQHQRLEEALQAFQELLYLEPDDPRILKGYHHARALLGAREEPSPMAVQAASPPRHLPAPVGPPAAVTALSAARRGGFHAPGARKGVALPRWIRTPRNQAAFLAVLVCSALGLALYGIHRREAALKEAVATAKRNALKPISRMVEVPTLAETVAAIREEAEAALSDDPLRAYCRAQEWQRRDPDAPAAAELARQARERMASPAPGGTLAEADKAVQAGDLETAQRLILGLLRRAPDDGELRARARKVALALVVQFATKGRMSEAADMLRLGRALFPQDPSWQVKLKLLESIQALAKSDRTPWIQLLG